MSNSRSKHSKHSALPHRFDPEKRTYSQSQYAENGFPDNPDMHLTHAKLTLCKNNGDFFEFKSKFIREIFHPDLECITNEAHFIEINIFQDRTLITNKSCSRILNRHTGDQPGVQGSAFG